VEHVTTGGATGRGSQLPRPSRRARPSPL